MRRRIPIVQNLYYRKLVEERQFGNKTYRKSPVMLRYGAEKTTEKVADRLLEYHRANGEPARKVSFSQKTGGGYAVFVGEGKTMPKRMSVISAPQKLRRDIWKQGSGKKTPTAFRKLSNRNLKRPSLTAEQRREVFAKGKNYPPGFMSMGVEIAGKPQGRHWDSKEWFAPIPEGGKTDEYVADQSLVMMGWRTGDLPDAVMNIRATYPGALEVGFAKVGDVRKVIAPKREFGLDRRDFADNKETTWTDELPNRKSFFGKYSDVIRIGNSLFSRDRLNDALKVFGNQEYVTFNTLQADDTDSKEWQQRNRHHANWRNKPDSAVGAKPSFENTNGDVMLPLVIAGEEFSIFLAPFTPDSARNPLHSANPLKGDERWEERPMIKRLVTDYGGDVNGVLKRFDQLSKTAQNKLIKRAIEKEEGLAYAHNEGVTNNKETREQLRDSFASGLMEKDARYLKDGTILKIEGDFWSEDDVAYDGHVASMQVRKFLRGGSDEILEPDRLLNTNDARGRGDLGRRYSLVGGRYRKQSERNMTIQEAKDNPNNIYYVDLNFPTLYFNTLSNQIRVTGDKKTKKPKITATTEPTNKKNAWMGLNKKNRPPPLKSQIVRKGTKNEEYKIAAWINPPVNRGVLLGVDAMSDKNDPKPVYLPVGEMDSNPQYQPRGGYANYKYGGGYPV